jgi:uncharacterized surface protein with fasciclin (FAS1) repeats
VADLDEAEAALTTAGLRNVLLYHVLGAEVIAADVSTGYATTLGVNATDNGLSAFINAANGVRINNRSDVTETDIMASNGVAHVIDSVLLPANTVDLVAANPMYGSLAAALGVADGNLISVLADANASFTVFAPDNDAFQALIDATPNVDNLTELANELGTDVLSTVLLYHVLPGQVRAEAVAAGSVNTAATDDMGGNISFDINVLSNGSITITDNSMSTNDATIEMTDITSTNGVIHTISDVLLPL